MILYDTPGMIVKRMNKLDEMMMQNVRTAALNADCVLVVVDAAEAPQKVRNKTLSKSLFVSWKHGIMDWWTIISEHFGIAYHFETEA